MAEEQGRSGGKSYGNRKSYGSGRGGNGGGRSFGGSRGGFRKGGKSGGFHKDGYRKDGGFRRDREGAGEGREFSREGGERRDFKRNDGERGGFRGGKSGGFHKGGFRKDGERHGFRRDGGFRRDDDRRDFKRDGERRDGERRDFKRNDGERRDFHRDGDRRNFHRDNDRRNFRRDDRRQDGENPRYQRDGEERRDFHKDGERRGGFRRDHDRRDNRRDFKRDDRKDFKREEQHGDNAERREFTAEEKREYRETKRREYMERGPRRNSDGTMSFPSQNPYTARRPDEPKMPKGMEWSMLSTDERERLRGLSKEHAENIGLHILAAYALEESDPQNALAHAKWVARQASRIDFARETLAFVAYRQGDYKLALKEFRTAYRMNGFLDYLPFIADCERGTGNPKKAVEVATSDEGRQLRGEAKVEMFLVYAGALADLGQMDKAIEIVHTIGRSKGLPGEYRMRAIQAEQYFLEEAGRGEEAADLDPLLDKLELQYADQDVDPDDMVIDHDLERFSDDELDMLGISEDDAQYAPSDDDNEDGSDDAESDASDEDGDESADAAADADDAEAVKEVAGMNETAVESDGDADAHADQASAAADDESVLPAEEAEAGSDANAEPETGIDDAADVVDESADAE
ncbi:tetratricopeptide repeat protein [Bifidobacterium biavatii]|uniref:Helicase n=1 Tax=Bifidobacterium biavatii DSM 23969 TaxID=1437608 RepID=A0A086ZMI6_9BIFI|nr:hypothetical protein [Bifidobacterium biavatii]KFI47736.1 hypothetical protein BBIA_2428 [Bifidobacterium biavatii DSM 23969]